MKKETNRKRFIKILEETNQKLNVQEICDLFIEQYPHIVEEKNSVQENYDVIKQIKKEISSRLVTEYKKDTSLVDRIVPEKGPLKYFIKTEEELEEELEEATEEATEEELEEATAKKLTRTQKERTGKKLLSTIEVKRYEKFWEISKELRSTFNIDIAVDHAYSINDSINNDNFIAIHPDNLQLLDSRWNKVKNDKSLPKQSYETQVEHLRNEYELAVYTNPELKECASLFENLILNLKFACGENS